MKQVKILFSCDDASADDMVLAELLAKYQIPAVFYIPIKTRDLMDNQIRKLAGTEPNCDWCKKNKGLFEVGAHTMTHPEDMKLLSPEELRYEVEESKKGLEQITTSISGRVEIIKFCYPSGRYNEKVKEAVKKAGFKEARTVKPFCVDFPKDPFETHPTIHIHPEKKQYGDRTWKEWAEEKLAEVIMNGGRFEIWCHGWEVELYHQWEFLEDFLIFMDEKMKDINYPRKASIPYFEIP